MRIFLPLTLLVVGVTACSSQAAMPSSRGIAATLLSHSGQPADLKNRRLFVSDAGNGNIYLYDVPSLKLVTILQGFTSPQGECADDNGNVWVTDNRADEIYQLSYAGRALGNISDTTGYPVSCAWDP